MLSGFCRMTVSLVVIMFELTGLLQLSNCCFWCPTVEWQQGVGLQRFVGGKGRHTFIVRHDVS